MPLTIPGLPEGVELVRVGEPAVGEYVWDRGIYGPIGSGDASGDRCLIVRPAAGYRFEYDITMDRNDAVKLLAAPKRLQANFSVASAAELAQVRKTLPKLPGFVVISED